jgi:hypothetical protein
MDPLILQVATLDLLQGDSVIQQKDNCVIPLSIWRTMIDDQEDEDGQEVLLVEVTQGSTTFVLHVDSFTTESEDTLFIPSRFQHDLNMEEYVFVRVLKEMPPIATRIVLEPLEQTFQSFDIATAVSELLSHWHVLSEHTILSVPCPELDGFPIEIYVKVTEPAPIVLLRGEVPLEIASSELESPPRVPVPASSPVEDLSNQTQEDDFSSFLPPPQAQAFVPFGGHGYRLGSQ